MKTLSIVLLAALACWSSSPRAASFEDALQLKNTGQLEQASAAFAELVAREPNQLQALEQLAIVQGWLKRYDASIASWRRLLQATPDSAAAHTGLARVLYWQEQRADALTSVDRALQIEPDNLEALLLQGDIYRANAQLPLARASYLRAQAIAGIDAELERKIASTAAPLRWRFDLGYTSDDYSKVRNSESSAFAQIGYRASDHTTVYLRSERFDNFGAIDGGASVGIYQRFDPLLLVQAELGLTPGDADFRPIEMLTINSEVLLKGWIQPLFGLRYSRYDQGLSQGEILTLTPGVRLLTDWSTIELRHGVSRNLDDATTGVSQIKFSFERAKLTNYVFAARGREASPPLPVANLRVFGAGSVYTISPAWSVRLDLTHEDRRDTYRRNSIGVGVSYRF